MPDRKELKRWESDILIALIKQITITGLGEVRKEKPYFVAQKAPRPLEKENIKIFYKKCLKLLTYSVNRYKIYR